MDKQNVDFEKPFELGNEYFGPQITTTADVKLLREFAVFRARSALAGAPATSDDANGANHNKVHGKLENIRLWSWRLRTLIREQGGLFKATKVCFSLFLEQGVSKGVNTILSELKKKSLVTEQAHVPVNPVEALAGPLFSIIVPIYNTPTGYLNECIQSVRDQTYGNWQLILVDDNSSSGDVRTVMSNHQLQDPRVQCVYRDQNGHISASVNTGLQHAGGDYFTVLDHDDKLHPEALQWIAHATKENPTADYIYSDEDKLSADGSNCFGAYYKPDWSPEYMLAMMYTCHMSVFKRSVLEKVGGYRSAFDGAQDYEFTLRVLTKAEDVVHVPKVLYHWRAWENSTAESIEAKPYSVERQHRALSEYLTALNDNFTLTDGPLPGHHAIVFHPRRQSLISIVIPTANGSVEIDDRTEVHVDTLVAGIISKSSYPNYEIVIVHNGDLRDEQTQYLESTGRVRLVQYNSQSFNLAHKINQGCAEAKGEYLVIMNDDIRIITEDWMERMLGMAQRDGVGVVGAKLLFPDRTLQHAGVVMLGGLPGHAYYGEPEETHGYGLGALVDRNCIAVTGACHMTPKVLFDQVGGYSERYALNYNDVDYCLKLHQLGYRAVAMADVKMFHYEGVSKEGGRSVGDGEIEKFLEDWSSLYSMDPFYNPNLSQMRPYG